MGTRWATVVATCTCMSLNDHTNPPQAQRCLEWLERKSFAWMQEAHTDPSALDAEEHVVEDAHRLVTLLREKADDQAEIDEQTAREMVAALTGEH